VVCFMKTCLIQIFIMIVVVCCGTCLTITLFDNNKIKLLNKSELGYPIVSLFSSLMPSPLSFYVLILSHILSIHQIVNTRNNHANANKENNMPPPPALEQVLLMHAQMLQTMQQTMANMHQGQGHQHASQPHLCDKLGEFQRTKPPIFSHSIEPLDVDDWLKIIEKKLQVMQCNNKAMVLFSSHQLEGPTSDWWDAYVDAHEEPNNINWQLFRTAFCLHHVPQGIIKMKKKEFQDLKQGSMSLSEYVTHFTQLSHYTPGDVDTDEKKQDYFLNGLNDGLAYVLESRDFKNFQGMVNKALVLENRHGAMECKRKQEHQHQHQASSNSRLWIGSSSAGPVFHPVQ
jgi:hypothetical protein